MYLQQVCLKNIACFDDIVFDFTQPSTEEPCRWVVLLGENGTGKSTVLKMIALSLLGRDMVRDVATGIEWGSYARSISDQEVSGSIEVTFAVTGKRTEKIHQDGSNQYHTVFKLGPRAKRSRLVHIPGEYEYDYSCLNETLYDPDTLVGGWFACGYGPWRTLGRSSSRQALASSDRKHYRFATMFNTEYSLTDVSDWLLDLNHQALLADSTDGSARRVFDLAVKALGQVLQGAEFKEITPSREIVFEDNGVAVTIDQLSDSYRSMVAWVGDLVRRLVQAFPRNPLQAQGIVLVDEIDIHLHPVWQRAIVEQIRDLFPNLQFIVSTHSPFIAQDMKPEDKIIVLKRQGDKVVHKEDIGFVRGWRVDQILTSYLFDLETTRDVIIESAEREYQQLLELEARSRLSESERRHLKALKQWLQEYKSLPGETVEENEIYDAARMLLNILDEHLSR